MKKEPICFVDEKGITGGCLAYNINDIYYSVKENGCDKSIVEIKSILESNGIQTFSKYGCEDRCYVSSDLYDIFVSEDPSWFKDKEENAILSLNKKLDCVIEMLSEMYVPIVQKKILEKLISSK